MNLKRKPNQWSKLIFPGIICKIPGNDLKIYLTFDDGPTPGITNQVLALLFQYKAQATFFCRGDQVKIYPELFNLIEQEGHLTGNHGYHHLHGWTTHTDKYIKDCQMASEYIHNKIFRPPFGRINPQQYNILKKDYRIYLWSALSWDFHPWVSQKKCWKICKNHIEPGSIIVFHDTSKAASNMLYTLPKILEQGTKQGYQFCSLPLI